MWGHYHKDAAKPRLCLDTTETLRDASTRALATSKTGVSQGAGADENIIY
jgi:hypothetical protein